MLYCSIIAASSNVFAWQTPNEAYNKENVLSAAADDGYIAIFAALDHAGRNIIIVSPLFKFIDSRRTSEALARYAGSSFFQ